MILEVVADNLPDILGDDDIPFLFQALYGFFKICILFLCLLADLLLLPIELIIFFTKRRKRIIENK